MSDQFDFGPADQEAIKLREAMRRAEEYMHHKLETKDVPMNEAPRHPSVDAMRAVEDVLRAEPGEAVQIPADEMDTVLAILEQRQTVHGDFTDDAQTAQALKYVMRQGKNWDDMPSFMREALEQMQTKIARILSGDPSYPDHWRDLQGYPRLVETRLAR
jgi:hypothetical protein